MLDFYLVYPELCQSLFLYLGGGNGSFRKIGWGDGITGLSKMCCVMLRCNALYCIVIIKEKEKKIEKNIIFTRKSHN